MPFFPGCMSMIRAVGWWKDAVFFSLSRTRSTAFGLGAVFASVEAVADSGGTRLNKVDRNYEIVVYKFATWKVYCISHQ